MKTVISIILSILVTCGYWSWAIYFDLDKYKVLAIPVVFTILGTIILVMIFIREVITNIDY